jgi:hypothetical protein
VVVAWVDRVSRRVRLLAFVTAAAVAVVVASVGLVVQREVAPEPDLSLDCLPFELPRTVPALNRLIARYRSLPGFVGADVGADVLLQDRRRLWVFGDTLRQEDFDGQRFVRNSMLLFSPGCATVVMPRNHGAVVPDRADGVGYWPMDVAAVHPDGYDIVGVTLLRVRTTGAGIFDFEVLGPAIAVFEVPVGRAPRLLAVHDVGPDDPNLSRPLWGAAVEPVGDTVYIYGTAQPRGTRTFGRALHVARANMLAVADASAWEYWDGTRWQPDAGRATPVIDAVGGVSQVLSVFERDGSWYVVSKRDDVYGRDLVIWKGPSPVGPFTPSAPLAQLPSDSADGLLRYMPLAHPDLLPVDGSVVVSYSRNVADLARLAEDPELYRPKFLRVPLP